MINFIKGNLFDINNNTVIIECNGIGYDVICPLNQVANITNKKGQEILLFTHLIHKEDNMSLYGFLNEKTRKGFLGLMKVSGIGPKAAIKILSHYDVDDLFKFVETEDINSLKNIPGIGPKLAKQIIFDLKGVIPDMDNKETDNDNTHNIEKDLISAMLNLGYKDIDIRNRIKDIKPLSNDFETEFKRLIKEISGKK